jgi:hypothetical protein
LCRLAVGLGRSLGAAFPREPEVLGLLALMVLHEARRPARLDDSRAPVQLPEQDRSLWDPEAIARGRALLDSALRAGEPGRFQLEAAISATHCLAATAADTDWQAIAGLYCLLERTHPSLGVRANRAFAVARAHGARAAPRAPDGFHRSTPQGHGLRGARGPADGHRPRRLGPPRSFHGGPGRTSLGKAAVTAASEVDPATATRRLSLHLRSPPRPQGAQPTRAPIIPATVPPTRSVRPSSW